MNLKHTLIFASLLFTFGCPSGSENHEHDHEHHEHSSEAIPESILGLKASGDLYTLEITSAQPDPANKGKNDWTIKITDSSNTPVSGATLTVVPFMTVHGHGTSPSSFTASAGSEDGTYSFTELNFIMAGAWDMTFTVSLSEGVDAGTTTDEIAMSLVVAN